MPQVFCVTGENMYDSPELRNCEASWGEPGRGEGEADDYTERRNRSGGSDSKMERLQDSGAMAEAGDDLRSYLSLWQKREKTLSIRKSKGMECDDIN